MTTSASSELSDSKIISELNYRNRFGFPYETRLSFLPLISQLEERSKDRESLDSPFLKELLKTVKAIPELMMPVEDISILSKYRKEVDLLMSTILPRSILESLIIGVIVPFQPITVYSSSKFREILSSREDGQWNLKGMNLQKGLSELIAFCGMAILEKYYNYPLSHPDIFKSKEVDKATGSTTFYQPEINTTFAEIIALKEPRPLSEIDLTPLKDNFFNSEFWLKNFPPDTFAIHGLTIFRMVDITDRELISQLEYVLLQSGSVSRENVSKIQEKFRSYFKVPDLRVGVAPMLSYKGIMAHCGKDNWNCFVPVDKMEMMFENFEGSIYHKAIEKGGPLLIDDIELYDQKTPIEDELLRQGLRSIIAVPVMNNEELIGAMELGSSRPHAFDFISLLKLKEIMHLVSVAFQRTAKEFDNRVQAAVKEHFTSIHPSVEWKFAHAAVDLLTSDSHDQAQIPSIEFKEVTPIYGQIDIRGSSEKRNEAIRQDMIEYLSNAREILLKAFEEYPLTILDELKFRVEKFVDKLQQGMDSGDETSILDFMKQEVESLFHVLAERSPALKEPIDRFFSSLDPEHQQYHVRRKNFEDSLTMINDKIARLLDDEEERTQKLLPHYFEKYKTDGVEYNIYLGQSILQNGKFDPVFVKNFRLWQLVTMVRIARETQQLLPEMATSLETTQLILCYSNPFSIMFRMDEKRFDVAGAYNIRYEIVKKRIDKAHVKGTNERITQPHKIAIIYTQEKEAREYERYFEYLKERGWIRDEIERLEVEPLQGMQGLKALRVKVNYETETPRLDYDEEELMKQVRDVMV